MKLSEVVVGQCISQHDDDGALYFIPERIEDYVVYGYSIYTSTYIDELATAARSQVVRKESTLLAIRSIPAIYDGKHKNRILMLKYFKVAQTSLLQKLIRLVFTMKVRVVKT